MYGLGGAGNGPSRAPAPTGRMEFGGRSMTAPTGRMEFERGNDTGCVAERSEPSNKMLAGGKHTATSKERQ